MERIWDLYEKLNGYVYATNIETNEIVYMNKKLRELQGVKQNEYIGQKCYKVIQGSDNICQFCNNRKLVLGEYDEWKYYNRKLDVYVQILDTLVEEDGVLYRLEVALDITEADKEAKEVQDLKRSERIANESIKYALETVDPDECINRILEYLGKVTEAGRAYIFEREEDLCDSNTYEWCAEGVTSEINNLQHLPPEVCRIWYERFEQGEATIIKDLEVTKETDPLMYDVLAPQGIKSLVTVPLYNGKDIMGFFGVDNPPAKFVDVSQDILGIIGNFIVSLYRRRDLFRKYKEMSYTDNLTGFRNRHSMDETVETLGDIQNFGIFYCDLNGLKKTNDTMGHAVGDRLIVDACDVMRTVFKQCSKFRVGGDEFIIFLNNVTMEQMVLYESKLREELAANNVSMSIGYKWVEKVQNNIESIISEAEKKMYMDKKSVY